MIILIKIYYHDQLFKIFLNNFNNVKRSTKDYVQAMKLISNSHQIVKFKKKLPEKGNKQFLVRTELNFVKTFIRSL